MATLYKTNAKLRIFAVVILVCSSKYALAAESDWRSLPASLMARPSEARDLCDRFAAHPLDYQRRPGVLGVDLEYIESKAAIIVCAQALKEAPDDPLLNFQYGRALLRTDKINSAIHHLKKSAELGHRRSILSLVDLYERGVGVPQDLPLAIRILQGGVQVGYVSALAHLGRIYNKGGPGIPKDSERAARYYEMAIEQGSTEAMYFFGNDLMYVAGAERNHERGVQLVSEAAKRGHLHAQNQIGVMYWKGSGVPRDTGQAARWFMASVAQGNQDAKHNLEALNRETVTTAQSVPSQSTSTKLSSSGAKGGKDGGAVQSPPTSSAIASGGKANSSKAGPSNSGMAKAVEAVIIADADSWLFKSYKMGSVRDVVVKDADKPNTKIISATYSYTSGEQTWIKMIVRKEGVECIEYGDESSGCRAVGYNPAAGLIADAILSSGQSGSGNNTRHLCDERPNAPQCPGGKVWNR